MGQYGRSMTKFRKLLAEISQINSAIAACHWDMEVYMPEAANEGRARTISYLSGLAHEKLTSEKFLKALRAAEENFSKYGQIVDAVAESFGVQGNDECVLKNARQDYDKAVKLPKEFVEEVSRVCAEAHQIWVKAKEARDFGRFLPVLKKIVGLKRQETGYLGFEGVSYNALLDCYEVGATVEKLDPLFAELRLFLVPLVKRIGGAGTIDPNYAKKSMSLRMQTKLNELMAKLLGFDFKAGRIDASAHPFTTSLGPDDTRITTRYDEADALYAIMSTIHETGHALYEQGLPTEHYGTALGEAVSMGIHESQSRLWENIVGRSRSFWQYLLKHIQKEFDLLRGLDSETLYKSLNTVRPSLIRTEADEVTYNLHVILRYEIEKELIAGNVQAEDLSSVWNEKMREYLGVVPADDSEGVLQDVHWSAGYFGYFPTYTLGNLYSAQFYEAAKRALPGLEEGFKRGEFASLLVWLRENIHKHGKRYAPEELVRRATGEPPSASYFISYLKRKYSDIYGL